MGPSLNGGLWLDSVSVHSRKSTYEKGQLTVNAGSKACSQDKRQRILIYLPVDLAQFARPQRGQEPEI